MADTIDPRMTAAAALYATITDLAKETRDPGSIDALARAYAAVTGAAPRFDVASDGKPTPLKRAGNIL